MGDWSNGDDPHIGDGCINGCADSHCFNGRTDGCGDGCTDGSTAHCYDCSPCDSCNACVGGCNNCYGCNAVCNSCNSCNSCQGCVECQTCVSCQTCNAECYEENSGYDRACESWYAGVRRALNRSGSNCRPGYSG